ncbi:MAG: peptide-methionine (S)-S-oxide reductase MsrA [bacterium]
MSNIQQITLAGGCFWCLEAVFQRIKGVQEIVSGYTGGDLKNPSYREVCSGKTGHAEVVQVTFDTSIISLDRIFDVFWHVHNPTTLNRQGADTGTQYRSAIFYNSELQRDEALESIKKLQSLGIYPDPIVTQVAALEVFYPAEDYHQDYYNQHPGEGYCQVVINPKLGKINDLFKDLI